MSLSVSTGSPSYVVHICRHKKRQQFAIGENQQAESAEGQTDKSEVKLKARCHKIAGPLFFK